MVNIILQLPVLYETELKLLVSRIICYYQNKG